MANYLVIFTGQYLEGQAPFEVEQKLSEALNLSLEQRERIFSGKAIVLKKTEDKSEALKLGQQLKALGADIRVKVEQNTPTEPQSSNASAPATEGAGTPPQDEPTGLSIAAQEGFIVPPGDEPISPVNDLSHLSLSGEDPGPLPEQPLDEAIQVDTSRLSIKDNDGTPLVDAQPEVEASVVAPEFGLDEPGAMLETIGAAAPIVAPDVSALSLREGEGNLIDDSEIERSDDVSVSTDHLKVAEIDLA